MLEHFETVHNSPSHIYHSALPFSPSSSWLWNYYSTELSNAAMVAKGLPTKWGNCSRTVSLDGTPRSLSCWKNTVAVGLDYGVVVIINGVTGSQEAILSGHSDWVRSVTFSLDGVFLVSGSDDKTLKLWDMQTGGIIMTFTGLEYWIVSVSISADCTKIASGSYDGAIHLWDVQTGKCYHVIKQQPPVNVSFSSTSPEYLMFMSGDKVWHWNTTSLQIEQISDGSFAAFTVNSSQFTLCRKAFATVQDSEPLATTTDFNIPSGNFGRCCFSPNGKLLVASHSKTAYIWDVTSSASHPVGTFAGHAYKIRALTFCSSSTVVTASRNRSIRFWQIGASSAELTETDIKFSSYHSFPVNSIALQTKDDIIITGSSNGEINVWGISTGHCQKSFKMLDVATTHIQSINSNGRLISAWYDDKKITLWNVEKHELLLEIKQDLHIYAYRMSGDGSQVFCCALDYFYAYSIWTKEAPVKIGIDQSKDYIAVDGSKVWVYSPELEYEGWDFGTPGSSLVQVLDSFPSKPHPSGAILWDILQSNIQETGSGKVLFQLAKGYERPDDVQWNNQYLYLAYVSGKLFILDCSHMLPQ